MNSSRLKVLAIASALLSNGVVTGCLGSPAQPTAKQVPASKIPQADAQSATEARRVQQLQALLKLRAKLVRAGTPAALQACDAEIKSHPTPAAGDSKLLSKRMVGKWRSPRHDYLYRADGTWTLLPAEPGTLHGRWRIDGGQLERTSGYAATDSTDRYTLILLSDKDRVFADGENVFCETKLTKLVTH